MCDSTRAIACSRTDRAAVGEGELLFDVRLPGAEGGYVQVLRGQDALDVHDIQLGRFAHGQLDAVVAERREIRDIRFKVGIERDGLEFGRLG